jgi:membrane-associated phospholipid phosphatase
VVGVVALADRRAVPFAVVVEIGASQTHALVNGAVRAPRPAAGLVRITEHPGAHGWPSGHAGFALVQMGLLVVVVGARLPGPGHIVLAAAGGVVVLAFLIQRIDAGVHRPSQTLGGLLVAAGWLTLAASIRWLGDPVLAATGRA